jgi:DNA-binding response OmpR family regulator
VAAGHAAGADGYLAKPFGNAELRTRVQELMERVAARRPYQLDEGERPTS